MSHVMNRKRVRAAKNATHDKNTTHDTTHDNSPQTLS